MAYGQDETATEATPIDKPTSGVHVPPLPYLYAVSVWVLQAIWPAKVETGISLLSGSLLRFLFQQMLADFPTDFVVSIMSVSSSSDKREKFHCWPLKILQSSPAKSKISPCLWTSVVHDSVEHFQQVWSVSELNLLLCCLQKRIDQKLSFKSACKFYRWFQSLCVFFFSWLNHTDIYSNTNFPP